LLKTALYQTIAHIRLEVSFKLNYSELSRFLRRCTGGAALAGSTKLKAPPALSPAKLMALEYFQLKAAKRHQFVERNSYFDHYRYTSKRACTETEMLLFHSQMKRLEEQRNSNSAGETGGDARRNDES